MAFVGRGRATAALALGVAGLCAATASAATAPDVQHTAAGTQAAQASLLRSGDFGPGWTSDAATGATHGLNFNCRGFTPRQDDIVKTGAAATPTFKAPSPTAGGTSVGPYVMQTTSVYESAKAARTLWKRAVTPALVACVAHSLDALASRGVSVEITAREGLAVGAAGERSAGYRI